MADHADDSDEGDIFVYRGGRAPQHVTHVRIDKSVDEIEEKAFHNCVHLVKVETHDGIRRVGKRAFCNCTSLQRINLKSVVEIDYAAFIGCENMADVEFGDELETIGAGAFTSCTSLKHLKLPSIMTIEGDAFLDCSALIDIELSERLETIGTGTFLGCVRLQRITIPLKRDMFAIDNAREYTQFDDCEQLTTVDLVGGIHKTVASLHMESWRAGMVAEINRINRVYLPIIPAEDKANVIRQWMEFVINKMDHYKAEHYRHVKEGITLLELALWKAKLDEEEDHDHAEERRTKKVKVDAESVREERRITCGADMVIKNVLPFLQLN
mmetsp:Transcript_1389/g.2226  ORF Transcript_1389/g.2226 Transcript_1389/m.2226 type:complete len:326 (-) Transcript_1389:214-1191(-)